MDIIKEEFVATENYTNTFPELDNLSDVFRPTTEIRWLRVKEFPNTKLDVYKRVLQQKFISLTGITQWRDVPTEPM